MTDATPETAAARRVPEPSGALLAGIRAALRRPVLLDPTALEAVRSAAAFAGYDDEDDPDRDAPFARAGDVGVVSIEGPLAQRAWSCFGMFGGDGYDAIESRVRDALEDPGVRAVVLRIDSPGGEVAGCFEAVRSIRAARAAAGKPIVAYADEMACSAAFALACAADAIVLPETGVVGSVGVIVALLDESEALRAEGLTVNVITSGAAKADGHPALALSDDARARIQAEVTYLADVFARAVAAARSAFADAAAVRALEARVFYGPAALTAGLADRVGNLASAIELARALAAAPPAPSLPVAAAAAAPPRTKVTMKKSTPAAAARRPLAAEEMPPEEKPEESPAAEDKEPEPTAGPKYEVGARVKVAGDPRMPEHGEGRVAELAKTCAYAVQFGDDDEAPAYKWYTEDELEPVAADERDEAPPADDAEEKPAAAAPRARPGASVEARLLALTGAATAEAALAVAAKWKTQLAAAEKRAEATERASVIAAGVRATKITPAMQADPAWKKFAAGLSLEQLRDHVATLPEQLDARRLTQPPATVEGGAAPPADPRDPAAGLTERELAIAASCGLTPAQYAAEKARQAATAAAPGAPARDARDDDEDDDADAA